MYKQIIFILAGSFYPETTEQKFVSVFWMPANIQTRIFIFFNEEFYLFYFFLIFFPRSQISRRLSIFSFFAKIKNTFHEKIYNASTFFNGIQISRRHVSTAPVSITYLDATVFMHATTQHQNRKLKMLEFQQYPNGILLPTLLYVYKHRKMSIQK